MLEEGERGVRVGFEGRTVGFNKRMRNMEV